ncbi:hypothetical protein BJF85_08585 [Saccharomonospora sp. CUA-673]|nr:hypothetical protein BJF85_08585 [Saccharomonospora sp. CUA-673]
MEWSAPTKGVRVLAGVVMSVICLVVATFHYGGVGWVATWWMWLLILPWPFLFIFVGREQRVSAGADWVVISTGDYVKMYELVKVTVHIDGMAHTVRMLDSAGRSARVRIGVLEINHRLWDLAYNGILHSVHVNAAETNKRAREYLLLDRPLHLREW